MEKYLVYVSRKNTKSAITNTVRRFSETPTDIEAMNKYIALKTNAGYTCEQYDLSATYVQQSSLIQTQA